MTLPSHSLTPRWTERIPKTVPVVSDNGVLKAFINRTYPYDTHLKKSLTVMHLDMTRKQTSYLERTYTDPRNWNIFFSFLFSKTLAAFYDSTMNERSFTHVAPLFVMMLSTSREKSTTFRLPKYPNISDAIHWRKKIVGQTPRTRLKQLPIY